jgi:hypothetical protein
MVDFNPFASVDDPYGKKDRRSDFYRYAHFRELERAEKEMEDLKAKIEKIKAKINFIPQLEEDLETDHSVSHWGVLEFKKIKGKANFYRNTENFKQSKKLREAELEFKKLCPYLTKS